MEWPVAFGDGLRVFPHHGHEGRSPSALLPDALHGTFGKPQSLWDEATVGKLTQGLRDDTTARDVSTMYKVYQNGWWSATYRVGPQSLGNGRQSPGAWRGCVVGMGIVLYIRANPTGTVASAMRFCSNL